MVVVVVVVVVHKTQTLNPKQSRAVLRHRAFYVQAQSVGLKIWDVSLGLRPAKPPPSASRGPGCAPAQRCLPDQASFKAELCKLLQLCTSSHALLGRLAMV